MSLLNALSGDTYKTSVRSSNSPHSALRTNRSMQVRNAASVFPEPVGAEISAVFPARMCGQPWSCGSVGVPKRPRNQSRTSGCAHSRPEQFCWGGSVVMAEALPPNYSVIDGCCAEDRRGYRLFPISKELSRRLRAACSFSWYLPYDALMRLLLVEDDARIARFVAKGLREQAYAVDVAATGEDALYQAAVNTYDLVILDVMIPAPDGFAVCCELRKSGQRMNHQDRKSTRLNSSHSQISYAVFCLKKKNTNKKNRNI